MNFGADLRVGLFLWSMAESCKSLGGFCRTVITPIDHKRQTTTAPLRPIHIFYNLLRSISYCHFFIITFVYL